jgi:hypothetical protein
MGITQEINHGKLLKPLKERVKMSTVTHDEDGYTYIKYREDKRPLKLAVYWIDSRAAGEYLALIAGFVEGTANAPTHIEKMEPDRFWALVERLATLFCREHSPTTNHGITKPEIRGAVYFILDAAIKAGHWPEQYGISDRSFVQRVR